MKQLQLRNLHFRQLLESFTTRKMDEGKSTSHINSVSIHTREFLYFLEERNIQNINLVTQGTVDAYFDYLQRRKNIKREGGLSSAYLDKHREAVLRFMEFIKKVDVGQSGIKILKFTKDRIPKNILTEDEVALLFNQCDIGINGIRNKAMLSLLYGCGLRKGELYQLNVKDFDISRNIIRIEQSKNSYQRDVPVSNQVKIYLEEYLYGVRPLLIGDNSTEQAFILNNLGVRLSLAGIQYKISVISKASGIDKPISPHRLRHAIATHLLGDFTIEEIALFLGHKNIDSTQIYTHLKYTKEPYGN